MKKSETFLNLVGWVMAGAIFATGAVIFSPRADSAKNQTAVVPQAVPSTIEQQ